MAKVEDNQLHVIFEWIAMAEGDISNPDSWVLDGRQGYRSKDLTNYKEYDLKKVELAIKSTITGETLVLTPPNHGTKLDPAKVKGLFDD